MGMDRRMLLGAGLAAAFASRGVAQSNSSPVERFPVWPGAAPGGAGLNVADATVARSPRPDDIAWPHVATPMLTVVRPAKPNGAALLLMPGGGYTRVAIGRGGSGLSRLFAEQGITVFELLYRLPHDGWAAGPDAPLQDAQRAIRLIRSRAATWGLDPARVGTVGFSAGGHLAARLASRAALKTYVSIDAADQLPARPIVAGLFFPVITLLAPNAHSGSVRELFGSDQPDPAKAKAFSAETDLPADMPPTYVACAGDDPVVPPVNSMIMYQALRARGTPSELAIFEKGGHGLPMREADGSPHPWSGLFLRFARAHGLTT